MKNYLLLLLIAWSSTVSALRVPCDVSPKPATKEQVEFFVQEADPGHASIRVTLRVPEGVYVTDVGASVSIFVPSVSEEEVTAFSPHILKFEDTYSFLLSGSPEFGAEAELTFQIQTPACPLVLSSNYKFSKALTPEQHFGSQKYHHHHH